MRRRTLLLAPVAVSVHAAMAAARTRAPGRRWTPAKAWAWARTRGWLVGCNFIPSTAVNQLEMWQPDTFDPITIDRELGYAKGLGFRSVRVFLHDLPFRHEGRAFLDRVDRFLGIAHKHDIGALLVLFDGVWDPQPVAGPQRAPRPGVHNPGWVQSPGAAILGDPNRHGELEAYVKSVIERFRTDPRVHGWDLFNEPENPNQESYGARELADKHDKALALLERTFGWARAVDPAQPLTAGPWRGDFSDPSKLAPIEQFMFANADVISFHGYSNPDGMRKRITALRRYERPILCTEYLARPTCPFDPVLRILRDEGVGAYNWGLVAGKTQTFYGWETWKAPRASEPPVWHHDILRADGTPFDAREVELLRALTQGASKRRPVAQPVAL